MRLTRGLGISLGLLLALAAGSVVPISAETDGKSKCDAVLRAMQSSERGQKAMKAMCKDSTSSDSVRVLVKTEDKGKDVYSYLRSAGGRVNSRHGDILSVTVPYSGLAGLAKLSTVSRLEAPAGLKARNDVTASAGCSNLEGLLQISKKYDGRGVVIGVIDDGIDTSLEAFRDENGKSRIAYYWKQSANNSKPEHFPTVVTPEGETRTYEYGYEFTAANIEATGDWPLDDGGGTYHGTHVAGIVGGRDKNFPGMAPGVQFIIVEDSPNDVTLMEDFGWGSGAGSYLDGVEYIISRAREMDLPLVITNSEGNNMGPHDGSTLFEQALQADVEQRNLIMCVAAGNEAQDSIAADVTIPAGETVDIPFYTLAYSGYNQFLINSIDVWSTGKTHLDFNLDLVSDGDEDDDDTIEIELSRKKGKVQTAREDDDDDEPARNPEASIFISDDEEGLEETQLENGLVVSLYRERGDSASSQNGDDRNLITIAAPDDDWLGLCSVVGTMSVTNRGDEPAHINCYLPADGSSGFVNEEQITPSNLCMPSLTPGVICVGSYVGRSHYVDNTGYDWPEEEERPEVGAISEFSSRGPVRNKSRYTGINNSKPDIVAPGENIVSQCASGAYDMLDFYGFIHEDNEHAVLSGTSMSTPAVAGLVALILQNMPDATPAQIKEILFAGAKTDEYTTSNIPNPDCGYGKVQATCAVSDKVVSPQPDIEDIKAEGENLVISGNNFVVACQVFVDDELIDDDKVQFENRYRLVLPGYLKQRSLDGIDMVKVVNTLAQKGADSDIWSEESLPHRERKHSGCFIATAAYGSYLEPEVMALRRFRDTQLVTNAPGRYLVDKYYACSPPIADYIAAHPAARWATRTALTPVVFAVSHPALACVGLLGLAVLTGTAYRRRRRVA